MWEDELWSEIAGLVMGVWRISMSEDRSLRTESAESKGAGSDRPEAKNGKPLKGEPELSDHQKRVIENNKAKLRQALKKIGRWGRWGGRR